MNLEFPGVLGVSSRMQEIARLLELVAAGKPLPCYLRRLCSAAAAPAALAEPRPRL